MAEWQAIVDNSASDWHNGLKPGSVVKCTDGYFKQEGTNYYITMTYKWVPYTY